MRRERVTIERIAQEVGLSKFSVSRALAGKGGVGAAARARIERAASELGYRPARQARRSQAPQTGNQVLFVMQDQDPASSELWVNMLHGAEREGRRRGFTVTARQARQFAATTELVPAVAGIILSVLWPEGLLQHARRLGRPLVCGGYAEPLARVDQIVGDDWAGGVAVGRLLGRLGHRRIGFVRGAPGLPGRAERMRGLRDGTRDLAGADLREIGFAEPGGFRDAFFATVKSGFAPSALFCAHDGMAVTAVSELLRLGIGVPDDISVVGFNDFASATQIVPQLTTVRMPQEQAGEVMMRCLAMRLASSDLPPLKIMLMPELIERASTASAREPQWLRRVNKLKTTVAEARL